MEGSSGSAAVSGAAVLIGAGGTGRPDAQAHNRRSGIRVKSRTMACHYSLSRKEQSNHLYREVQRA